MRKLLPDMNRDRNVLLAAGEMSFDKMELASLRLKYEKILDAADREYLLHPPTKYYIKGFNLAARLRKFQANHLLFLEYFDVPFDNNLSEQALRVAKGKMKAGGSFRSMTRGLQRHCDFLSIAETSKYKGGHVYQTVRNIFGGAEDIWSFQK